MLTNGKIWVGNNENSQQICLLPSLANRHGLIAGATGTGKTVTLKVLAESFSDLGVPVFLADVKGDLAGMVEPGADSEDMQKRISRFSLAEAGFSYQAYPATFYDLYGRNGIPLRTTISEMGPLILSRMLGLTDIQGDLLTVAFKVADDQNLLLVDTKDLKAILNHMADNNQEFAPVYGNINKTSVAAIIRSIVALETVGGDTFFGEPALDIHDWFTVDANGKGMISILDSQSLVQNGTLYSLFLLWMMSELFETLPEVGDPDKPKMVFFFDEAHLLFKNCQKALLEKIEQVVKLIRSKGVGIYFITQNPKDIPDGILSQLGNKVEHALHAYTPADQKAVRAAAQAFRINPAFDTEEAILSLGTGEAVVSFLMEDGAPGIAEKISVLPPRSRMGGIDDAVRERAVKGSLLYSKYSTPHDPDSAYEFLTRMGLQAEAEAAKAAEQAALEKEKARAEAAAAKEKEKQEKADQARKKRAVKAVGTTVTGTIGREVGKTVGSSFGKFGKTLGGNVGASLGRGLLNTLFKL